MGLFDQSSGAPSMFGGGASPSALTSPGMNPQMLQLLMMLQQHAGQGQGGMGGSMPGGMMGSGGMPPPVGAPAMPPQAQAAPSGAMPGAIPPVPQQNPLEQMQKMMELQGKLKQLFAGAQQPPQATGSGTGGLY